MVNVIRRTFVLVYSRTHTPEHLLFSRTLITIIETILESFRPFSDLISLVLPFTAGVNEILNPFFSFKPIREKCCICSKFLIFTKETMNNGGD